MITENTTPTTANVITENTTPATATVTTENTKPTTATKSTTDSAVYSSTEVDPTQCLRFRHGSHDYYDYDNGCAQRKCSDLAQQHNTTKILCREDKIHPKALCQNSTKAKIETCRSEHKIVEIIPPVGPEKWCDGRTNAPNTPDFPKGSDEAVELCTLEKCEELNQNYGRILCGEEFCVEHTQDGIDHCEEQGRTVNYFYNDGIPRSGFPAPGT